MTNVRSTHNRQSWLDNHQVRFGFVLALVAAAAISVIRFRAQPEVDIAQPLQAVQQRLKHRHLTHTGRSLEKACERTNCRCALEAVRASLDADMGPEALRLLDATATCKVGSGLEGQRAEALVRSGALKEGADTSNRVLAGKRTDPWALQAQALTAYRLGAVPEAKKLAAEAVAAGRGSPAHLLLGLILFQGKDLEGVRREFRACLATEPDDVDALYNLALVAGKQDRYGEARKLYLRVLTLDPKRKEARMNLGVLAHGIGADAEAKNHLRKLEAIAPGDPLVLELRKILATPAPRRGQVLSLGTPGSAPAR